MKSCFFILFFMSNVLWATESNFQKVIKKIGDESPKILAAKYNSLSDQAVQISNKLAWTPSLTAGATWPVKKWGINSGEQAELQASLNILRFGSDFAQYQEGQKTQRKSDIEFQMATISVEAQAARLIFKWIELQNQLLSQKALLGGKNELVQLARDRFRRGQLPQQEVDKVRLDASNAEMQIRQAEVDLIQLQNQLDAFIPGLTKLNSWPWGHIDLPTRERRVKPTLEKLNFHKLKLRQEILSHQKWQVSSQFLPTLDLVAVWQTPEASPLGNGEWSALLSLTVPLWTRGETIGQRRALAYAEQSAQMDLKAYEYEYTAQNQSLDERFQKLKNNLETSRLASKSASQLAKDSLRRFQMGRASVNDLLIDQARVYEIESLAHRSLHQYHLVLLEYCEGADVRVSSCYQ